MVDARGILVFYAFFCGAVFFAFGFAIAICRGVCNERHHRTR
jgi:hypothetical protein